MPSPTLSPLPYKAVSLPAGLTINSSGLISGTLSPTADGSSPFTTTVTATADSASQSFTWTVGHFTLTAVPDRSDVEGTSVSVPVSASDADHDTLSYSASGLPPGISINAATGLLSGVLGAAASGGGPYTVTVTASDGNHSSSQSFTWTVTPHLLLAVPTTQINAPGDVVSLPLTAVDVANQPVTYSGTGLPPGLSLNSSSGLISGTLSASADTGSPYSVSVTATEGGYSSSQTFVWNISRVVIAAVGDQSNMAGDSVSLPLSGRNADNMALTWSASGLPSGLSINPSTGLISGTVAAGADVGSPYAVTVTAAEGGHSSSQTLAWTVSAAVVFADPGDQSDVGGAIVSLPLSATDNHGGTLVYSAVGLPAGLSIDPSTGIIAGTIAASAVSATPYDVIVSANDGSYGDSLEFNWTVAASGVLNPGPQSSLAGSTVSLSLAAADAAGHALTYSAVGLPPGLSLNASTGLISGTIPTTAAGNRYAVTVTVSDGTTSTSQSFEWEVTSLILSSPGDQTSTEGVPVSLALTAQDASSRTLTYTASGLPAGLSINASSGLISGTTPVGQGSSDSSPVTVTVSDGLVSVSQTFNWAVLSVAALDNPGAQTNAEGAAVSLQMNGAGDGVTFSAVGLPAGLTIDSSSGLISGSIGYGAAESNGGTYTATVTAQDDLGHSVSQSFTWTVSDSHFAVQGVDVSALEGTSASVPVANFSVDDTTLLAAAFTATVDWGDGTTPTAGSVSGSAGTFAVTAPHSYASAGVYTVSTTVSGPQGTLTTTSTAVVDDAALAATGSNLSAVEGVTLANATLASFVDPATPDSLGSDTATIDWGDGSTGTGIVSGSGTTVSVSGSHAYAQAGNYQATITLQSGGGDDESATALVTVADAALTAQGTTATATEGQMASLTLASFSDPNANALNGDFQVSINWGDGTPVDSADAVNGSPSAFSVVASHPYAESGNFVALVTITDSGGATATASTIVTVADAALTASGVNFSTTVGQPLGNEPVATFVDANPASQASDFSVSIDWGNGATSPGQIMGSGGEFAIYNDYVYQQPGIYSVTVTILEDGQTVATAASTATVGNLVEGQSATLTVMSFNDTNPSPPSSYTATIAWGDGTSSVGTVTGNGPYSVQGSHAYASPASYGLVITVSKGSSTLSATGSVVVVDAPLTVFAANVSTTEGQALSNVPVAIFTDANPSASPTESVPTILWGDGTPSSGGTVVGTGPIYTVFASHPYVNAGSYAVEVTLGQAKGVANGQGTAFVKPNWNDTSKYKIILVSDFGGRKDLLPSYLPGYKGNKPVLTNATGPAHNEFTPQQLVLALTGVGSRLARAAGFARVTFQIPFGWTGHGPGYLVTSLPGYAGNATSPLITGPQKDADYSFDPAINQMQADGYVDLKRTDQRFYIKDYGGKATVWAQLLDTKGKVLHTFSVTVPVDLNRNGIADAWEVAQSKLMPNPAAALLAFANPNWDQNPFPNMTNTNPKKNDPEKFPAQGLDKGDGLSLFYEYRGVLVDGGGSDPFREDIRGHVRLSPAVKNVLLDVDMMKAAPDTGALDFVVKAFSQEQWGAGVTLYYAIQNNQLKDQVITAPGGRNDADKVNNLLSLLRRFITPLRKSVLGVPVHQFWRHLTMASTFNGTGLPASAEKDIAELSGFSSFAGEKNFDRRAGSFVFFQDARLAAGSLEKKFRPGTPVIMKIFLAGAIIHELAHQLDRTPGHYPDSDGDGTPNTLSDYQTVQFDYTQAANKRPGYFGQDYYPLPDLEFKFGHAFASKRGTFVTNMLLGPTSFLDKSPP